jgi:hypothetical protein
MAVTITTQFYAASLWKNLAKVVFTSPNMDTPNTAGTRSHILPGQQDLGLWYEDTSNMYMIESSQSEETSTYFGYVGELYETFDLDNPGLYLTIINPNHSDWIEFVRQSVDINVDATWDSWPLKFGSNVVNTGTDTFTSSSGTTSVNAFNSTGWTVTDLEDDQWVEVQFTTSKRISLVKFQSPAGYESKYFKILAKYNLGDAYTELYTGQMYYSNKYQTHYFSNFTPYKYYRILIQSQWAAATGKGIKNCKMYEVATDESITTPKPIYIDDVNRIYVNTANLINNDSVSFKLEVDSVIGTGTVVSGTKLYAWGWPNWKTDSGKYASFNADKATGAGAILLDNYDSRITTGSYVWLGPSTDVINNGATERLLVSSVSTISITVPATSYSYKDGDPISATVTVTQGSLDVNTANSVVFEVTNGEAYNCRLTAWDDVTHSSNLNTLFINDNCRVSALAFNCKGSKTAPTENAGASFIHPPVVNQILKGNTVYLGEPLYYGDFDLKYRVDSTIYGDFLMFKPMLYGLSGATPYGVHDYVICLHYSYT